MKLPFNNPSLPAFFKNPRFLKSLFYITVILSALALIFSFIFSSFILNGKSKTFYNLPPLNASAKTYALLQEGAYLSDGELSVITSLPASYFIEVTAETDTHYAAAYSGLTGYVLKSKATPVDYEPVTKFAAAYFTANNDTHPVIVRAAPSSSAAVLTSVPDGEKAYLFGQAEGEALLAAVGTKWYYVKYETFNGYVYSAQGTADVIPLNIIEKVQTPDPPSGGNGEKDKISLDWIIVLALCLPAVVIMFALFSRKKTEAK